MNCEMVMLIQKGNNVHVPQDHDVVVVDNFQIVPMGLITVECNVGNRVYREELMGYKNPQTGVVFTLYSQFDKAFC